MKKLKVSYKPAAYNMAEFIPSYNHTIKTLGDRYNRITAELDGLRKRQGVRNCVAMIFAVVATHKVLKLEMKVEKLEKERKAAQTPECTSYEEFMADCNEKEE